MPPKSFCNITDANTQLRHDFPLGASYKVVVKMEHIRTLTHGDTKEILDEEFH